MLKNQALPDGWIYAFRTQDGYILEAKEQVKAPESRGQKKTLELHISCMSGCPVGCRFCATARIQHSRSLTSAEMAAQVDAIRQGKDSGFWTAHRMKICFLGMGEPFLNIKEVKQFIDMMEKDNPGSEILLATIGVIGSDYSWIKPPITLQFSLHSLHNINRQRLIPYPALMSMEQLSTGRLPDGRKILVDVALVEEHYDTGRLTALFPSDCFDFKYSLITPI